MEPNAWYYRRRANEEMMAACRAITEPARDRRLQLVKCYLDHLHALGEPWPFPDDLPSFRTGCHLDRSAFDWGKADGAAIP